jgi:aspartate aminotransferase
MISQLDQISFGAIVTVRDRLLGLASQGRKVYRLESGDPNFAVHPEVKQAMRDALDKDYTHYTASAGIVELRRAIVEKCRRSNHIPVSDPNHVVVTSGGMHALFLTFASILETNDEVIIPDPMWTEIAENIRLAGGYAVRCPMDLSKPNPYTADMVERYITPNTKAIFLNTPHNPTGVVLSESVLKEFVNLAEKYDLIIVSDEAYEHVIFDGLKHVSVASLPGAYNRTISLFSSSKSYAMSGLRIGYVVSNNEPVLDRIKKLLRCSTNGVNSVAQYGAVTALSIGNSHQTEMAKEYENRRNLLLDALLHSPHFTTFTPSGSFFLWTKLKSEANDVAFTDYMIDKAGVGSSPGSAFGPAGRGYIRFAFSCSTDHLAQAIVALKSI